ncbi:MAG: L-histidine N(alpha)-methyltransferase, partial [Hymenobacteraceae bacterium]|nr:L-histidine N(alpha)-methyltransferase [Hymenobacteraceae bacterium]
LLRQLLKQQVNFEYVPVDISASALEQLKESLQQELPDLAVQPVSGEYFEALQWLQENKPEPKVLLFLGSNIGNFEKADSIAFLQRIRQFLNKNDKLLLGCDLRKDPRKIRAAYDDSAKVTAEFNYNLLRRINRELQANFEVDQFEHFAEYDPVEGVMKSFLISKKAQKVTIGATGKTYSFKAWEAIHTENSYKYSLNQIEEMAGLSQFRIEASFTDKAANFTDVVLKTT